MGTEFNLFESIKTGLEEAIEVSKGNITNVKIDKIIISPLRTYGKEKIKTIRTNKNMTQHMFADLLGVSVKTVEAWESGTRPPSGTASRILELLERDNDLFERTAIIARQETRAVTSR